MSHHQPSRDTAEFYAQYRPSAAGDVDLAKQIMLAPGGMETLLREAKVRMTATGAVNGSSVDEALLKLLVQVEANGCPLAKFLREQTAGGAVDAAVVRYGPAGLQQQVERVNFSTALHKDQALITAIIEAQRHVPLAQYLEEQARHTEATGVHAHADEREEDVSAQSEAERVAQYVGKVRPAEAATEAAATKPKVSALVANPATQRRFPSQDIANIAPPVRMQPEPEPEPSAAKAEADGSAADAAAAAAAAAVAAKVMALLESVPFWPADKQESFKDDMAKGDAGLVLVCDSITSRLCEIADQDLDGRASAGLKVAVVALLQATTDFAELATKQYNGLISTTPATAAAATATGTATATIQEQEEPKTPVRAVSPPLKPEPTGLVLTLEPAAEQRQQPPKLPAPAATTTAAVTAQAKAQPNARPLAAQPKAAAPRRKRSDSAERRGMSAQEILALSTRNKQSDAADKSAAGLLLASAAGKGHKGLPAQLPGRAKAARAAGSPTMQLGNSITSASVAAIVNDEGNIAALMKSSHNINTSSFVGFADMKVSFQEELQSELRSLSQTPSSASGSQEWWRSAGSKTAALIRTPTKEALAPSKEIFGTDDFWQELRAQVYRADVTAVSDYIIRRREKVVSQLASDIFSFQLGRSKFQLPQHEQDAAYESCVEAVGNILMRKDATRDLFTNDASMISMMSETWREIGESMASPRTFGLTKNDGVHKLGTLVSWYQIHLSYMEFQTTCQQMLSQTKKYRRAHSKSLIQSLIRLKEACRAQADSFSRLGLPNHKQVPPMALLLQVCNTLAKETVEDEVVDADINRDTVSVLQMMLSLATQTDAPTWSDDVHNRVSGIPGAIDIAPESHTTDFRRELSQIFQHYVTMLRGIGGPARPAVSMQGWLMLDEQTDLDPGAFPGAGPGNGNQVDRRRHQLESAFAFATACRRDIAEKVHDAPAIMAKGMMALALQVLRDAARFAEVIGTPHTEVQPTLVRQLLVHDFELVKRICDAVQVAATYEISNSSDLVLRLSFNNFRFVRVKLVNAAQNAIDDDEQTESGGTPDGSTEKKSDPKPSTASKRATSTAPSSFFSEFQQRLTAEEFKSAGGGGGGGGGGGLTSVRSIENMADDPEPEPEPVPELERVSFADPEPEPEPEHPTRHRDRKKRMSSGILKGTKGIMIGFEKRFDKDAGATAAATATDDTAAVAAPAPTAAGAPAGAAKPVLPGASGVPNSQDSQSSSTSQGSGSGSQDGGEDGGGSSSGSPSVSSDGNKSASPGNSTDAGESSSHKHPAGKHVIPPFRGAGAGGSEAQYYDRLRTYDERVPGSGKPRSMPTTGSHGGASPRRITNPGPSPKRMARRSWDASSKNDQRELVAVLPESVVNSKAALDTMLASSAWTRDETEAHASGYVLLLDPATFEGNFFEEVLEKLNPEEDLEVDIEQLGPFNVPNGNIKMFSCNGIANSINRQDFESILDARMFKLKGSTDVVQQTTKDRIDGVHLHAVQLCMTLLSRVEAACSQAVSGVTKVEVIREHARLALEVLEQVSQMNIAFKPYAALVARYSEIQTTLDRVVRLLQAHDDQAAAAPADGESAAGESAAGADGEVTPPRADKKRVDSVTAWLAAAGPSVDGKADPFTLTQAQRVMMAAETQMGQLRELAVKGDWEAAATFVKDGTTGSKDPLLARELELLQSNKIGRAIPDNRNPNIDTHQLAGSAGATQLPSTPRGGGGVGSVQTGGERLYNPADRTAPLGFEQEPFVNSRGTMHGSITVFTTTHNWLEETVRDCRAVRELLDIVGQGVSIQEFDMGLKSSAALRDVMRSHFAAGVQLPQVFFGKYRIGGLAELKRLHETTVGTQGETELQSLLQQFVRSKEWEEVLPEQLELQEKLGVGASGEVRAALWHGNPCAVKLFNPADTTDFRAELGIMHQLRHPNVLNFYGAVTKGKRMCLVSERCACSVYQQLQRYGKLSRDSGSGGAKLNLATRVRYALDASKGMVFLHKRHIIHRDLKSSNLLIANDQSKTVKICDFSFSRLQGHYEITGVGLGTPGWVPPEETMGELVTTKADVYSFAMILWELLQSEIPYADLLFGEAVPESLQKLRLMEICAKDLRPPVPTEKAAWFQTAPEDFAMYCDLMTDCWKRDPDERPSFEAVQDRLDAIHARLKKRAQRKKRAGGGGGGGSPSASSPAARTSAAAVAAVPAMDLAEKTGGGGGGD